ncbi:biopolymer transporter ExbD [candidate division KSB1 bacterium]|nr:biopolymer transporter ExbD [candidate division KSB1 bacterium]
MQFKETRKKSQGINITSLIDVMFILLIFFMVSSSFIEQPGMKLELPTTKSQEVAKIENLVIYISKEGDIQLNEIPVALENLPEEIKKLVPQLDEKTIILKADKESAHGLIVQVMDISKRNGLEKIVIGTKIEPN